MSEGGKIVGQVLAIIGAAIVLTLILYYYAGGVAYVRAIATSVGPFVSGVENLQKGYPAAA
jgi:hypothetical protein